MSQSNRFAREKPENASTSAAAAERPDERSLSTYNVGTRRRLCTNARENLERHDLRFSGPTERP